MRFIVAAKSVANALQGCHNLPQVKTGQTKTPATRSERHYTLQQQQQNLRLGKRAQIERKINGQFDSPVWDSHRTAKKLSLFICEYAKRNDDAPPRHHLPVPAQHVASSCTRPLPSLPLPCWSVSKLIHLFGTGSSINGDKVHVTQRQWFL